MWEDNRRRTQERFLAKDIINKYSADYKVIFVGDATMAPYEITNAGGSIEQLNEEPEAQPLDAFAIILIGGLVKSCA